MKGFDRVFKTAGILLAGILAGVILLAFAFLIPVNEKNRAASYDIMEKEGMYPSIPVVKAYDDGYSASVPGLLDNFTDSIMLHTALDPEETNVLRAAMDMRQYEYYWHGYVAVLRPLLAVFDYGEIRVLNGMAQLLLLFWLCMLLRQRKGTVYALLALSSYFLLMPLAMPFSLQYSWVFYIATGGVLYLVWRTGNQTMAGMRLYRFFLVMGMLTSFFDLLTYPLYTWGIPIIWLLLLWGEDKKQSYYVKQVVYTGLWWILGYAGMWMGKFCMGSLILGRNLFGKAFAEVGLRLGVGEAEFNFMSRLRIMYQNWRHYEYGIFVLVLAVWFFYAAAGTLWRGVRGNVKNKALALAGVSSAVWYLSLANHTAVHHYFTYRIWGVAVLAVLAILVGSVREKGAVSWRQRGKIFCVWAVCGALGCCLTLLIREPIEVTNGWAEYFEVKLEDGENCEMRFTPTFSVLRGFGLCLRTEAQKGVCRVTVSDGERELYLENIALGAYGESTYAGISVDWRLKRGRDYTMRLSTEGADADVMLLVTSNQNMPLIEYGEVSAGGKRYEAQILSGLTYSFRPVSHRLLFFLAMTWTGLLFAVCMAFITVRSTPFAKAR